MIDAAGRRSAIVGWLSLAVWMPFGLTLEVLRAWVHPAYLASPLRRELWTLAHAHGNWLGIVCLLYAALAERTIADADTRRSVARSLAIGAVAMPLGFFLGGLLTSETDPAIGIALAPLGGLFVIHALVLAGWAATRR